MDSRYEIPTQLDRPSHLFRYLFLVNNCCLLVFLVFSAVVVYCVKGFLFHKKSRKLKMNVQSEEIQQTNHDQQSSRSIPLAVTCQQEEDEEDESEEIMAATNSDPSSPMTAITTTNTNTSLLSPRSNLTIHSESTSFSPRSQLSSNPLLNHSKTEMNDHQVSYSHGIQPVNENHFTISLPSVEVSDFTRGEKKIEKDDTHSNGEGSTSSTLNESTCSNASNGHYTIPLENVIYNRLRDPSQFIFESFGFKFPITISLYLYRIMIAMWALVSILLKQLHFEKQPPLVTSHFGIYLFGIFSKLYRNSKKIGIPKLKSTNFENSNLRTFMLMASNGMWLFGEIATTSSVIVSVGYWIMFSMESSTEVSYFTVAFHGMTAELHLISQWPYSVVNYYLQPWMSSLLFLFGLLFAYGGVFTIFCLLSKLRIRILLNTILRNSNKSSQEANTHSHQVPVQVESNPSPLVSTEHLPIPSLYSTFMDPTRSDGFNSSSSSISSPNAEECKEEASMTENEVPNHSSTHLTNVASSSCSSLPASIGLNTPLIVIVEPIEEKQNEIPSVETPSVNASQDPLRSNFRKTLFKQFSSPSGFNRLREYL
ncbi:hypothetical protein C9374_002977 [Naegleria lovaniensis]|uniref:Uncharacterized protein n=1 Tax=Naegleria lovaniensis TaxID=51637 RepID=A0AA88GTN9_NAELO|nr:uncharacterized protein C9374_002977 [Naegleria lovaniensis]KAG2385828.1 hypothetical protein C9374_002977 [Naegleria lovaniensis]